MKFIEYLESNSSKRIYVDPCSGNNGDVLIWKGMLEALKGANVVSSESPEGADLIIINGSGNFIDAYKQGIKKVQFYTKNYPHVPLCIAPSSFYFKKFNFGELIDTRSSPIYIYSRERYSKRYIDELAVNKKLLTSYLDDDLAFQLRGSETLRIYREKYERNGDGKVLVVDRTDIESPKTKKGSGVLRKVYSSMVPNGIKDAVRMWRTKHRNNRGTQLTSRAKDILENECPGFKLNVIETLDLSRNDLFTFDEFVMKIAEADYIFSNRLHAGVLGFLLDKNVFMEEGSYHKIKGIYEYSMVDNPKIRLI